MSVWTQFVTLTPTLVYYVDLIGRGVDFVAISFACGRNSCNIGSKEFSLVSGGTSQLASYAFIYYNIVYVYKIMTSIRMDNDE
jgi:hypothetical protein